MSSRSATSVRADDQRAPLPDSSQSFPKSRRLLRRQDFQRVYAEGIKVPCSLFLLFVRRREAPGSCRVGLTASRKFGNAVQRNRAKRLLREVVRGNWRALPEGCDCVLHMRARMREASYARVESEALRAMERARATLGVE